MGTEVDEKEVFFSLFQDLATKTKNYQILQMLYWNLVLYKDKLGQDSFEFQQKSHQFRLRISSKTKKQELKSMEMEGSFLKGSC